MIVSFYVLFLKFSSNPEKSSLFYIFSLFSDKFPDFMC